MKEQKSFEITFRFTPPSLIGWIVIFLATITIVGIITISVIASESKIEDQQDTEIHNVSNDEWVQIGEKGHCAFVL